ncbi:GNAT family N-acetyltransferase [Bacillus thuringiensis]|uniref:GNAT family N-acetyltransferase n=1 Tax=Bacillus thuringiensis TaxID=1428 RepID=UPI00358DCD9E
MDSLHFPFSADKMREWIEEQLENNDEFCFIAVDTDNNIVGIIEIFDCNRKNGTFDYYLAVFEPYRAKVMRKK